MDILGILLPEYATSPFVELVLQYSIAFSEEVPDSLWRSLFGVVRHAGSAARLALIVVLSKRSVCQPIPMLNFLLQLVVTRVKPCHHASAPYIAVFMIHAGTALIIGSEPAPHFRLLIRRISYVSR